MAEKIVLSDKEKEIIGMLDDSLYTIEYIEEWINRNDNVFVNRTPLNCARYYRHTAILPVLM